VHLLPADSSLPATLLAHDHGGRGGARVRAPAGAGIVVGVSTLVVVEAPDVVCVAISSRWIIIVHTCNLKVHDMWALFVIYLFHCKVKKGLSSFVNYENKNV